MGLVSNRAMQALRRAQAFFGIAILTSETASISRAPTISAGTAVPTIGEPDGSVYLRTAGSSVNEVLYLRQGGSWEPVEADSSGSTFTDGSAWYTTDTLQGLADGVVAALGGTNQGTRDYTNGYVVTDDETVFASLDALDAAFGDALANLTTTAKTLVGAINEVDGDIPTAIGGNTSSQTTGISVSVATELAREVFTDPAAAGTAIVAQQSADFDITSSIATPVFRNAQCAFSAGWDGGNIEITGEDMTGASVTETIVAAAGSTVQGVKAWANITRVRNLGTRTAGTVDVQEGVHLGVPVGGKTPTALQLIEVGSGPVSGASLSSAGLVDLNASPPNGTRDYLVVYTLADTPVVTDSGHSHAATGLTLS